MQDQLIKKGSTLPIVFLTGHADIPTSVKAIKAGAEDFLTKPVAREQLLASIERAIARHERTKQQRDRVDALRGLAGKLTPRESEVFKLVILGKMNRQIARELGTTERTIKAHRQRVMQKFQVQSLAELVSIGERIGACLNRHPSRRRNREGLKELNYFFHGRRRQTGRLPLRDLQSVKSLTYIKSPDVNVGILRWRVRRCLFRFGSRWPQCARNRFLPVPYSAEIDFGGDHS